MSRVQSKPKLLKFGEKLQILRSESNLTLQQFAESLGYSAHGYISELESSKKTPTVEFVLSVSRVYNVSIDILLKDELKLERNSK